MKKNNISEKIDLKEMSELYTREDVLVSSQLIYSTPVNNYAGNNEYFF